MLNNIKERFTVADFVLIALLVLSTSLFMFSNRQDGSVQELLVYKEQRLIGLYPLGIDRVVEIDEHSKVEIKDHKVRMLESDCPDKRCVKQGFSDLMPIICLPNKLVLEIRTKDMNKVHYIQ